MWLDWMDIPFGRIIVIGFVAIRLLTTGAPSTRKWPVVPESDGANSKLQVMFFLSKIFAAAGKFRKLFAPMIFPMRWQATLLVSGSPAGFAHLVLAPSFWGACVQQSVLQGGSPC